jgi:hypothetical protein
MQRLAVTCLTVALACAWSATGLSAAPPQAAEQQLLTRFCVDCHSGDSPDGKLRLDDLAASDFATRTSDWERVVRKLELGEMPPGGSPRPDDAQLAPVIESLTTSLDRLAEATPHPGRTESFRRLTRREYQNAVRDLLGVEIDASSLLPADESSHGFDNITVTGLTPTQVIRSITAAEKIARLAVGTGSAGAPTSLRTCTSRACRSAHAVAW